MDWDSITRRLKEHPLFVVLAFIGGVVIPIAAQIADILSPIWAALVIVCCLCSVIAFLLHSGKNQGLRPLETIGGEAKRVRTTRSLPVSVSNEAECNQLRDAVRENYLSGMGDKARLEYFYERAKAEDPSDSLYREVMETLQSDADHGVIAAGVDEWVSIGFETLCKWRGSWKNRGTLNQLYIAAYQALLTGDLRIRGGVAFARYVMSLVAGRRRDGH